MPPKIRTLINRLCRHDPSTLYNTYSYSARLDKIEEFKKKNPIRGFLVYTTVDWEYNLSDWYWQYFYEPATTFLRRFVSRRHLTKNGMTPGDDLDVGEAVLHSAFNVLVDFVEREIPRSWIAGQTYEQVASKGYAKWQVSGPMKEIWWHRPKFGVELLERFMDMDHHLAREIRITYDLYTWWTVTRPLRPLPNEASGIRKLEDEFVDAYGPDWAVPNLKPEDAAAWYVCDQRERDIYQEYVDEDTKMLLLLVQNRSSIYF